MNFVDNSRKIDYWSVPYLIEARVGPESSPGGVSPIFCQFVFGVTTGRGLGEFDCDFGTALGIGLGRLVAARSGFVFGIGLAAGAFAGLAAVKLSRCGTRESFDAVGAARREVFAADSRLADPVTGCAKEVWRTFES